MEGMTTGSKLLAQDDIDALLGEAGLEGGYESEDTKQKIVVPKKQSPIRFAKKSDDEVRDDLAFLFNKAFLIREDDVKVIWNANGTLPMASGFQINIQGIEYTSLGVLHVNHLVVKGDIDTNSV